MARIITTPSGYQEISILDSYISWKKKYPEMGEVDSVLDEKGSCPRCDGFGEGRLNGEPIRCLCQLIGYNEYWRETIEKFGTGYTRVQWSDFQPAKGDMLERKKFDEQLQKIHQWNDTLHTWLLLMGGVGTGKSMMMKAIATFHAPYALYLDSGDFEQKVFMAMQNGSEYTVAELVKALSLHPILLLDDIGAEYSSPFPKTIMRNIINRRYSEWQEFVTVVATNHSLNELAKWDVRMADRLTDANMVSVISLINGTWRNK